LTEAKSLGATSVQDMDGSDSRTRRRLLRLYQQLAKSGRLTLRIDLRWPLAAWDELARLGVEAGQGDDWVKIGGLKGFVDGSLGSSTAKMFQPYLNEPGSTGRYVTPLAKLREYLTRAGRRDTIPGPGGPGRKGAAHARGAGATAGLPAIYAGGAKGTGPRDRRFRIEHAQHLRPQDYPRFRELGVVASLQPYHVIDDG